MVRNKYPEETRKKILEVSRKLFFEKGYDNTSIQDIVNELGGFTKSVIYYHFESKFAILDALMNDGSEHEVFDDWHGENGLEKLQNSIRDSFNGFKRQSIAYSAAVAIKSPKLLGELYISTFNVSVPAVKTIVDEGINDGSIVTDYPQEIAELTLLTLNLWIGVQMNQLSETELKRKVSFIKNIFDGLGVPVLTDVLVEEANVLINYLKDKNN